MGISNYAGYKERMQAQGFAISNWLCAAARYLRMRLTERLSPLLSSRVFDRTFHFLDINRYF
jgi:hypothetical protein